MTDVSPRRGARRRREYRFVLVVGAVALLVTSIPYLLGATLATDEQIFGGFVYAVEDCYSYLAKMRRGAEGAWLFHIPYTPEPHPGALFYTFYLLLGKKAALLPVGDLTARMILGYHGARVFLGVALLLTVYRFLEAFTERLATRRLAWLMITFGGGLGWLLIALGQQGWLGSLPLDFILPEGFTFLVLYAFPHIALGRTLLLWGLLFLLKAWGKHRSSTTHHGIRNMKYASHIPYSVWTGILWLAMGLVVPFYVAVAWAVMGAACLALSLRERRLPWSEALKGGVAALVSAPIVIYSAWRFTSDRVYATWAAQNRIFSPHPLHYLAAYGVPLALGAFAVREAWRRERPLWLALAWIAVVPCLVYLPFNLQRRLVEGVQVPLSLLAALGVSRIGEREEWRIDRRWLAVVVMAVLVPTNVLLVTGNSMALRWRPPAIYRDTGEVAALDWLSERVESDEVVLGAYATGNYLPVRVGARAFVGHGPESVHVEEKKALVARFFDAATGDAWRKHLLTQYGVDYVFWGPKERDLGAFDPRAALYLQQAYEAESYAIFEVGQ